MQTMDERELLVRLRKGDEMAFVAIYDLYKDALAMRLLYLLKSDVLAEEALQDLFMKVWELRASINLEKSFRSYLYRIAENRVVDVFRKAKRQQRVFQELMSGSRAWYTHVEESINKQEYEERIETMLRHLPDKRRKIFIACKLEGKSYKETAEEFGVSITTVNDHIQKAMQYLKDYAHSVEKMQFAILIACLLSDN